MEREVGSLSPGELAYIGRSPRPWSWIGLSSGKRGLQILGLIGPKGIVRGVRVELPRGLMKMPMGTGDEGSLSPVVEIGSQELLYLEAHGRSTAQASAKSAAGVRGPCVDGLRGPTFGLGSS